ncbi:hypothetical protein [Mycolicibacterium sp. GF69]|uniref:hypothetical protein n=1 Tax=Mycolicibacterium sp. GF69 TaxID=2267251 RepID=UPI00197C385E|nr:hypothetical protein [Mycolicibacterium sp. GF69]
MQRIAIFVGGLAVAGLFAAAPAGAEPGVVDCSPCARTTTSSSSSTDSGTYGGTLPERWAHNAHALGESWANLPARYAALPGEIVANIASIPGKIAANYDADPTNNSPE